NEAALLSARRGRSEISMSTLEEAVERATLGISRAHVLTDAERQVIAVHESGHVLVARVVPDRRGNFTVRIPVPEGAGAAIYRAATKVATRSGGRATARTFTLPRALDLR
ncbi:MAG: hypothetical protein KY453_03265, partial [Gemmatimonadetes bacterium]|nr:hypothetical protein [Gemmatimonadota bacterium]